MTSEALLKRLAELRWNIYRLAKEHAKNIGSSSPASRYHTSLSKALANIDKSSFGTIKSIVQALRGEIFIVWSDVPSEEKGKLKDEKCSPEERLENLELMLAQVLMKLNQPGEQSSTDYDKS
ncbi:MAG: hypothetical protein KME64_41210 [Scytonematopsis contorta HA4267-MV1]|nr:hypothetical protein [Scytonematopsis contorta HA4267-MV1]